ncbi:MAG: hypothetical protein ACI837_000986 [Crocinitomicaceae bacterium]|jgi:hypothetical protein
MMRILLFITLTCSLSVSAQTFHIGKPIVVTEYTIPASSETGN